jgi:hypothetical protein
VGIGQGILQGPDYALKKVTHFGSAGKNLPTALNQLFIDEVAGMMQNYGAGEVMPKYLDGLTALNLGDIEILKALHICRKFFQFIDGVIVSASGKAENSSSGGLAIPRILELLEPIHAQCEVTTVAEFSIAGEYSPFIVPLIEMVDTCIRMTVPTEIPSITDAIEMYLKQQIDIEYCQCLVEINGGRWSEWRKMIQTRREKLHPHDIINLWRRDMIDDAGVNQRLQELGIINEDERQNLLDLATEVPTITDLLRFITKNVFNDDVVKRFKLDDAIDRAVKGPLPKWLKANGINQEALTAFWREHWQRPAWGHAAEMVYRLRPEKFGIGEGQLGTTLDDFKLLLLETDWLPFWGDRMAEILYKPIPMRQLIQAYAIGQLTKDRLIGGLQDVGYSLDTATEFATTADFRRHKALEGSEWVRDYQRYGINRNTAFNLLKADGYQDDEINAVLDVADFKADIVNQEACVTEITKRIISGDLAPLDARHMLTTFNLDANQIDKILTRTQCYHKTKERHEKALPVCDYYMKGLIGPADFLSRMINQGYTDEDAKLALKRCNIRLTEQEAKQAQRELDKAKRLQANTRKAARARERMANDLVKVAEHGAKVNGSLPEQEAAAVTRGLTQIMGQYGMSYEVAHAIIMDARLSWPSKGPIDIYQTIVDAAAARSEIPSPEGNGSA